MKDSAPLQRGEGHIELLDGSIIPAFYKETPGTVAGNSISLDTTGEYLSAGGKPKPRERQTPFEEGRRLLDNIGLILDNTDLILSDSRVFLAPVGIVNGLAYTGTSGFRNPTLGVYVEWWKEFYEGSHDADGNAIWFISGSPLSGANACASVSHEGEIFHRIRLRTRFCDVWQSFMEVNRRYDEAKAIYEALTLDEAIELLK